MEPVHHFRVIAWWASGRTGIAKSDSALSAIHFTSPHSANSGNGRWTPEDLLLCAVASCYTTTFQAVADQAGFAYVDLQVEVNAEIKRTDVGYTFSEIRVSTNLTTPGDPTQQAIQLLERAEALCSVYRALAVKTRFEPNVRAGKPQENTNGC
jgi:organic hydroperoxide reductase OsmC/OhrA